MISVDFALIAGFVACGCFFGAGFLLAWTILQNKLWRWCKAEAEFHSLGTYPNQFYSYMCSVIATDGNLRHTWEHDDAEA